MLIEDENGVFVPQSLRSINMKTVADYVAEAWEIFPITEEPEAVDSDGEYALNDGGDSRLVSEVSNLSSVQLNAQICQL